MTLPKRHPPTVPHYVYRCYDEMGDLLYVGCSNNPLERIYGHRLTAWWGGEYVTHRLTVFPNREKALSIERQAIWNEMPRCNVKGRWLRLDPRDHWTAQNYLDFHHALRASMEHTGLRPERSVRLLSEVEAELQARHNVAIARRSA